ncbi:MAG: hypothetical protein WCB05_08365 [Candidatus Sulfotelmatobacter sp.]
MKLPNVILRALVVFVAACIIQAVAGALLLSQVKIPAAPHALGWIILSTLLVVAALSVVAFRSDLRGWSLGAALAGIPLVIGCVNTIEGIFFLTNSPIPWSRLFAFMIVSAVLIIPVWALLFGKRPEDARDHYHPIASQSIGEKLWKFVVSDFAYSFLYITAGAIVFPYVKDFYATQHLPTMPEIFAMQLLLRGPVFILLCLALVRMLGMPRLAGALAVGAVFTILSGVAPLLLPNPVFPDAVRWAHLCEVTSSNFVFGAIVAWLWGRPGLPHPRVLRQAA